MKKLCCCLLALIFLCASSPFSVALASSDTFTFVDSTGRSVVLPTQIDKIAVTGTMSQMVLLSLASEKLVGLSNELTDLEKAYLPKYLQDLPVLGQLFSGNLNLESLVLSGAQVVLDIGEPKGNIKEQMDILSLQTGIPFVHIDMHLPTMKDTYHTLGKLLNIEQKASEFSAYCDTTYQTIFSLLQNVQKKEILYVTGQKGINVIAKNSYQAEIIDFIADNQAVLENPSAKGIGNEVDMEQILKWNADYIFFSPESVYDSAKEDVLYSQLKAINEGHYYRVPKGPYNFMGFPPSVQRLLGMMWMCKVLYPEQATYDLYEETKAYYALFYQYDLTEEKYQEIMAFSL